MQENFLGLDEKVIIVAGAAGGGIGTAVTRLAAAAGATVIAVDSSAEKIARDLAPLVSAGQKIVPVLADVLTEEGVGTVLKCARAAPGTLHGLVTVVGGGPPQSWGPTTKLSREVWHSQLSLNVDSMLFITQAVAAELQEQGLPGSIVAITSLLGLTASPFNAGYGAGKRALLSLVETFALELARDGIRVNAVAPGATQTPTANLSVDPARARTGVPLARLGHADEIAAPVLFLLSSMSSYMTGQCLVADGGCSIKWSHLTEDNLPMFLKPDSVEKAKRA